MGIVLSSVFLHSSFFISQKIVNPIEKMVFFNFYYKVFLILSLDLSKTIRQISFWFK